MIEKTNNISYKPIKIIMLKSGALAALLLIIGGLNFTYFHLIAELICVMIAFSLFTCANSVKGFNNNDEFIMMGLCYGIVGVLDLLHMISCLGTNLFGVDDFELEQKLWIGARFIEVLILNLYAYAKLKDYKGIIYKHNRIIFAAASLCLLIISFKADFLSFSGTAGMILSGSYIAAFFMMQKAQKSYRHITHILLSAALGIKAINWLFLCLLPNYYLILKIIGHILKSISFYILYKAVIDSMVINPYLELEKSHSEMELMNEQLWDEVNQRIKAQKQLRDQYEFTQKVIDSIPNPMFYKNSKGLYQNCNRAFEKFIGIKKEDIIGKTVFDISDRSVSIKLCQVENILYSGNTNEIEDIKLGDSEGNLHHVMLNKAVIHSENEEKSGIVGVMNDITNRKRYERELRNNELRSRALIQLLPEALCIHNGNILLYANSAAIKLIGGQKQEDIIGKKMMDFVHDDFKAEVVKRDRAARLYGKPAKTLEERMIRLDGSFVDVEVTTAPFPYNGENCVLAVCHDITERKKSEENLRILNHIKEMDRLKTEFFSNISHELRTPLNVLLGSLQLMDMFLKKESYMSGDAKLMRYSQMMRQNCYRLLRLVNNLIDITKMDSGYFELHLKNYNIVDVVENITQSVVDYAANKGISLSFDTDLEEKFIACDADKIERIILNLLSNSIKFTEAGGNILVTVSDMDEKVRISVKDDGIGIPKEKRQEVFERFRQVDELLTRKREGSGIGLSLVKSIVEMHDGEVYVESEYGKGSEFIVELPARSLEEENSNEWVNEQQTNIERINIEFSDIYG